MIMTMSATSLSDDFYKLVEIKLKEKSCDIETEVHVTLNGIYEPTCHSV